jgi:hypothetical protein
MPDDEHAITDESHGEDQEGAMSDTDRFPRTLRVGILVFDGFEPIDVWGFVEAFSISRFIGTN